MIVKCKLSGKDVQLPCSARNCPLFGDCIVEYEKATKKKMTNAERIRGELLTDEGLAELLVVWLDDWGEYDTPVGRFETREEAVDKTVEWLHQEST